MYSIYHYKYAQIYISFFLNNYITQNPLSQFEIRDLLILNIPILNNLHFSVTNVTEYLVISFVIITMLNSMTQKNGSIYLKN